MRTVRRAGLLGAVSSVVAFTLVACGSDGSTRPASPASTDAAATTDVTVTDGAVETTARSTVIEAHPTHEGLAAALPTVEELTFLPAGTTAENDTDLTSRLQIASCTGTKPTDIATNQDAATNRLYLSGSNIVGGVTFYDVATVDVAAGFISTVDELVGCLQPANGMSIEAITPGSSDCDHAAMVRTHQPSGLITVDGWCQVGNLLGWFRLDPTYTTDMPAANDPGTPPTDEQALALLVVVGAHLRTAFAG